MDIALESRPRFWINGLNATRAQSAEEIAVPVIAGRCGVNPHPYEALIALSDIQFREARQRPSETGDRLLGQIAASQFHEWLPRTFGIAPQAALVALAGDLWSSPMSAPVRGGYGDVRPVWNAFADSFAHVIGVPGNHDIFEENPSRSPSLVAWRDDVSVLDAECVDVGDQVIGGVGGCVGNPKRPFRYSPEEQRRRLAAVLAQSPDLLLLHQGPPADGRARAGAQQVEELLLEHRFSGLLLCGHEHWDRRVHVVGEQTWLNLHEAVLVLTH